MSARRIVVIGTSGSSKTTLARRIVVIGTSGSGKTTLARRIASKLGISHIELDALHWEPGWTEAEPAILRERVASATSGQAWVADGNYGMVRDLVWPRATTLVWLDYAFPLVMWRITSRTVLRFLRRETLWNGNREDFRLSFLSRDSVILWAMTTHHRHRRDYPAIMARPEHAHLDVHRHRSPRQTEEWLQRLS
jgi:adenylate kinase family enzyme